uniref:Uncharacterized protein n=1 Tax=Scleropages formosus TaxID=113540 RepID=A0A8C9UZC5_SCLFO
MRRQIEAYNKNASWDDYCDKFEQFCMANSIDENKKVATLLAVIGTEAYALLQMLLAPEKPAAKSCATIIKTLKEHLSPVPSTIAECFRFYTATLEPQEGVVEFKSKVRHRFVYGFRSEAIQRKLITEKELTLRRAVEITVAMEAAQKDTQALSLSKTAGGTASSAVVSHRTLKQINRGKWKSDQPRVCRCCGGSNPHLHLLPPLIRDRVAGAVV